MIEHEPPNQQSQSQPPKPLFCAVNSGLYNQVIWGNKPFQTSQSTCQHTDTARECDVGFWTRAQMVTATLNWIVVVILFVTFCNLVPIWNLKRRNQRRLELSGIWCAKQKKDVMMWYPILWRVERCRKDAFASCGWFGPEWNKFRLLFFMMIWKRS